jgi:hypothetical protein
VVAEVAAEITSEGEYEECDKSVCDTDAEDG